MLGEFLINQKRITNEQLTEALNAQVIFGGRLGTNLIEAGALTEEELGTYLAQYHHLNPVTPEKLNNIPSTILNLIPINVVKRLKVIPFDYKDKQLYVAMMDPQKLDIIDELSFVTGFKIRQYVVPEIRLLILLEKYYGIKRDIRYITLSRHDTAQFLANKKKNKHKTTTYELDNKNNLSYEAPAKPDSQLKPPSDNEDLMSEKEFQDILKANIPMIEQEKPTIELSHAMELEETLELKKTTNLNDAVSLLLSATSRDDIASVVLGFALSIFKRAVIFMIQKGIAIGWEGAGEQVNRFNIKQLIIPLDQPSIFKFAYDMGAHFIGPPQATEFNKDFFLLLGGIPPKTAVVIPVYFMGRIVQMLYGDNGAGNIASTDVGELLILLQKVPEAIEKLVIKRRVKP
jgi:hypothetical protein